MAQKWLIIFKLCCSSMLLLTYLALITQEYVLTYVILGLVLLLWDKIDYDFFPQLCL